MEHFFSDFESLTDCYDCFVKHYRDADSKVSAVADLAVNRDVIERDLMGMHSQVDYWIQMLSNHLLSERINNNNTDELAVERQNILKRIKEAITAPDPLSDLDQIFKQEADSIREFYSRAVPNSDPIPIPTPLPTLLEMEDSMLLPGIEGALSGIKTILTLGKVLRRKRSVLGALDIVLERIIDEGYPDFNELGLWEELTPESKGKITRRIGNPDLIKNATTFPEGFSEDAKMLINENPDWTQEAIAETLIEKHFNGDSRKLSTVKRKIRPLTSWK